LHGPTGGLERVQAMPLARWQPPGVGAQAVQFGEESRKTGGNIGVGHGGAPGESGRHSAGELSCPLSLA
jgi:hypothetical protein